MKIVMIGAIKVVNPRWLPNTSTGVNRPSIGDDGGREPPRIPDDNMGNLDYVLTKLKKS